MKLSNKRLLLAGLMATIGFAATAQNAPAPAAPADTGGMMGMHRGDPAKMHERMQAHRQERATKRLAALKAKLKITASQEGAWTTFSTAMMPPANAAAGMMGMRHDPKLKAEMDKLTTPERIDKMRALRQQRMTTINAVMDKRADATKAFYGTLSSEQKAVFDAVAMQGGHRGHGGMMGGHRGGMGGEHQGHGRMGQPS
ncbi:MAG: Spy/CpxP family protein refolding chaperone [Burkholderiaceae bacterium]